MRMIGVLAVALFLLALPAGADAYDRLVNPFHSCSLSGVPEYDTLQDAVNAASPGDQIGVCPGTYDQFVSVDTSVTLTAIGSVVISPSASKVNCFGIGAADVTVRYFVIQNCTVGVVVLAPGALIQNNQFRSTGEESVEIDAPGAIVQNNLVEDSLVGIATIGNVTGSTIKNNTLRGLSQAGIFVSGSGVIVTKNSIQDSGTGIDARRLSDATISFNSVSFNVTGITLSAMGSGNQVTRNVVTRSSVIDCQWDSSGGVTFSKNTCGTEAPAGAWD